MKKLTTIILLFCSTLLYSQRISDLPAASNPSSGDLFAIVQGGVTKKVTYDAVLSSIASDNPFIDSISFSTMRDSVFFHYTTGSIDTLIIPAGNWTLTGDDLENANAGKVTIGDTAILDGEVLMPNLGTEQKIAYLLAWLPSEGSTKGKIYPTSIILVGDSLADAEGSVMKFPDDSTYQAVYNGAWTDVNTSNESRFRMARKYLVNWFNDLYTAIYDGTDEAIMAMLGDSYQWNYYNLTMRYVSEKYGFGGGYYNMQYALAYANTGSWYIGVTNWTLGNVDRTDAYNFHNRYATSSTAGGELFASCTRFNEVRVNYRIAPGDGTFSIQVGYAMKPDTIDCAGTAAAGWHYYDISHATKVYPTDTVILKLISGTVRVYGIDLRYIEQDANEDKAPIIIHCLGDGGSLFSSHYSGKDTATVNVFLDSLNASLITMTFLDAASETPYTTSDSLIGLIKQKSPLTDILLIGSHEVSGGTVANQLKGYEAVANSRQVAFASSYDFIGDYDDLSAAGLIPDGTHASGAKNFMYQFFDTYLFPQSVNRYGTLTATDLNVWGDANIYGQMNDGIRIGDGFYMYDASNNLAIIQTHKSGWVASGAAANVAIGENTLNGLSSGDYNTATGASAGQATSTGSYNSFYGRSAGASCTSTGNTFVGALAGQNNNGGTGYNTFVGYSAGFNNDGSTNTFLGRNAGYTGNGDGNVFLGYNAGFNETGSNKLYIENSNSATPLIGGDFSANTLTVNGTVINPMGTIADNDDTPSFAGGNVWKYNGTANSVSLVSIDDHQVGAFYTIIGNSDTYTITVIHGTPAGGDSFTMEGTTSWVGGLSDVLVLYCVSADNFIEVSRSMK